jgi:membrane protease YdiL (CAAX protease family)
MNTISVARQACRAQRTTPFLVFLLLSLILFEPPFFAFNSSNKWFQVATFVGLPLFFSTLAIFARRSRRFVEYWPAFSSFVIASTALLPMWLLDELPARWLGVDLKSPPGRALVKVTDTVILVLTVLVLAKLLRIGFDSIYLRRGKLALGLIIGLAGFAAMSLFAIFEAHDMGISNHRLLSLAPWILTFVLANGFFEELMSRALFLKKFEPFLGAFLSNLLTAVVFGVGHAGVTYTTDVLVFAAITFIFALIWGYLMQKTGSLWASALFHAGADTLLIIGIFTGIKT